MMIVILFVCFVFCLFRSLFIDMNAASIMHQIYGAEYSIMATLFFCSGCIIDAINNIKKTKDDDEK